MHPIRLTLPLALALACTPLHAQEAPEPAAPDDPEAALELRTDTEGATRSVPLDEIRRYVAVFNMVREAYVEPVDEAALMQSAIRGLLHDLDPHSAYLAADDSANL